MAYLKGNHCNNNCKHFFGENETVYNRNHGGDPGSTDYEEYRMYCCANSEEGIQLLHVVYNCPIYQAVEHGVQPTPESGRDLPVESTNSVGSAPAISG